MAPATLTSAVLGVIVTGAAAANVGILLAKPARISPVTRANVVIFLVRFLKVYIYVVVFVLLYNKYNLDTKLGQKSYELVLVLSGWFKNYWIDLKKNHKLAKIV